ncbi:MAG TPA: hypothetical protein VMJ10_35810, partial [Kofleriaceae bacterium]|nr:hypothetical protein [Kofleriaceae bacterium]
HRVMMRISVGLVCMTMGCGSTPEAPSEATVRERLAQPTALYVAAATSSGAITASRYTHDGWQDGQTALAIADGELDASVDATGALAIAALVIELQPIELPSDLLGQPAELRDVKLRLASASSIAATWSDDDDASATATVDLSLDWTLAVGGNASPLGTEQLQGVALAIALAGGRGEPVTATVTANGAGELWTWADLLKLEGLSLAFDAVSNP